MLLDARDAAVVDIDVADNVRRQILRRIDAARLAAEADPGKAEVVGALRLDGRQTALDPHEAARAVGEMVAQSLLGKTAHSVLVDKVDPAEAVGRLQADTVAIFKRLGEPA